MRPAPFNLLQPRTVAEAAQCVAAGGRALAGGQALLPALRLRDETPATLVDLSTVRDLDATVEVGNAHVRIGALTTVHALLTNDPLAAAAPWLTDAARQLGDVQVRNLATVVGNLCWADPRANLAVALLAAEATVIAADADGRLERIALDTFFSGFRRQVLAGRLVVAVELPRRPGLRGAYLEFSRQPQDLALVNVCAVRDDASLRVAIGGIDPTPVRLREVERDGPAALTVALAASEHEPIADHYGDADYKLHLAGVLVRRALCMLDAMADSA